jgi:hypothetical protein
MPEAHHHVVDDFLRRDGDRLVQPGEIVFGELVVDAAVIGHERSDALRIEHIQGHDHAAQVALLEDVGVAV